MEHPGPLCRVGLVALGITCGLRREKMSWKYDLEKIARALMHSSIKIEGGGACLVRIDANVSEALWEDLWDTSRDLLSELKGIRAALEAQNAKQGDSENPEDEEDEDEVDEDFVAHCPRCGYGPVAIVPRG